MRFSRFRHCLIVPVAAVAALGAPALSARADNYDHDHIYADSFGNLIVMSAAGFKRIVVGEGDQAKKLQKYTASGGPHVVYADRDDTDATGERCWRPPYLIKGRSYMYGFDQGEIPFQGGPCR